MCIRDRTYYLQEDGTFKTGWVEKDGKKYYYEENGNLVKDTFKDIDGKKYAFDANGEMITNTEKDGYTIGEDGVAEEIVEQADNTPVSYTHLLNVPRNLFNAKVETTSFSRSSAMINKARFA